MFTQATKSFGVWKEGRKSNKLSSYLSSVQFLVALSIMAFVVYLTLMVVVKIRQEFFLVESAPIYLTKSKIKYSNFLIPERIAEISIFVKESKNNSLYIYFENGESFYFPKDSQKLYKYLEKRQRNIIFMSLVLRMNAERNSRVKVWTQNNITFSDIQNIMRIFSKYGFDNFDFSIER